MTLATWQEMSSWGESESDCFPLRRDFESHDDADRNYYFETISEDFGRAAEVAACRRYAEEDTRTAADIIE